MESIDTQLFRLTQHPALVRCYMLVRFCNYSDCVDRVCRVVYGWNGGLVARSLLHLLAAIWLRVAVRYRFDREHDQVDRSVDH